MFRIPSKADLWWIPFVLICFSPLITIFIGEEPLPRPFWVEFAVALGFLAFSIIFLQFLITARVRSIAEKHGIDVVLHMHRLLGFVILLLVLLHPLILFIHQPSLLIYLHPLKMPLQTLYGLLSAFSLIFLMIFSIFRRQMKISFEIWRISHGLLALTTMLFGGLHLYEVHYYLEMPWKQLIWGLFVLGLSLLLLYVRLLKPMIMLHKPWHIISVIREGPHVVTIALKPVGHKGLVFVPGQFAWLKIGQSPLWIGDHPFTISSAPASDGSLTFTIKEIGDFTSTVQDLLPGSIAYIDGPYGIFSINNFPHSPAFVLIAGGIGITPMMSMLRFMNEHNDKRPVLLIYAAKSEEDLIFLSEITSLKETLSLAVIYVLKEPSLKLPSYTGLITLELLDKWTISYRKAHYFLCGPPLMNNFIKETLDKIGIPFKQIHLERFDLV